MVDTEVLDIFETNSYYSKHFLVNRIYFVQNGIFYFWYFLQLKRKVRVLSKMFRGKFIHLLEINKFIYKIFFVPHMF